jgi:hypothetical protein
MRTTTLASIITILAACGSEHGTTTGVDAPGSGGDANGSGDGNGGNQAITVTLTNRPNTASTFSFLAAYQDGSGAWQAAPPPTGDTYTFTVSAQTWGFAWTCVTAGSATREVSLYYFTVAEATNLTIAVPDRCTDRTPTAVALNGTISNPPVGGGLSVAFARSAVSATTGTSTTYAMSAQPATHDLLVGHSSATLNGDVVIDKAAVQRSLAVSGTTTTANVNYNNAQSTQTATVTVNTTAGQTAKVSTTLYTAGGTVYSMVKQTAATSFTSTGLAGALAQAGDVYNQQIDVSSPGALAIVQNWVASVANQTYSAPASLGGAASTVPTDVPYPRIKTTWAAYSGSIGYDWSASQSLSGSACGGNGGNCSVIWTAALSPGAVGTSPTTEMPDLSALTGWDMKFQMQTGTNVTGSVRAATSSKGASDFPVTDPAAAGTQRTFVSSTWTATP